MRSRGVIPTKWLAGFFCSYDWTTCNVKSLQFGPYITSISSYRTWVGAQIISATTTIVGRMITPNFP